MQSGVRAGPLYQRLEGPWRTGVKQRARPRRLGREHSNKSFILSLPRAEGERERGRERGGRPMWTDRGWCISERRRRVRAGERVRWSRSGMLHNWLAGLLLRTDRQTDHERLHGLVCLHLQSILHSLPRERQQNVFTIRTECSKQLWLISMLIRSIDLIKAAHAQYASQDSPNIAPQRIFKMTSRSNVTNTYACVARSKGYSSPIFQRNIDCY